MKKKYGQYEEYLHNRRTGRKQLALEKIEMFLSRIADSEVNVMMNKDVFYMLRTIYDNVEAI